MPAGLPSIQDIVDGKVTFFSLDTDVIQSAAYDFSKGALNQLPRQLPAAMSLQLTEIVLREIVGHKLVPVKEAAEKFYSAVAGLTRLTGLDLGPSQSHFQQLNVMDTTQQFFEAQVQAYVGQCGGSILHVQDVAPEMLFDRYFKSEPPFGFKTDKKSEFPDAAALLLLEKHAEENDTQGILASRDGGWQGFANQSQRLYCVQSVDELAKLFADTGAHAQTMIAKITAAVADENSVIRTQLTEALRSHVGNADWDANDLTSSRRIEAEVSDVELVNYHIQYDSFDVWKVDDEPDAWVVELMAAVTVEVTVDVEFFVWDSIDREEIGIGSNSITLTQEIDVGAYLTCSSVRADNTPDQWEIEVEIGQASYSVDEADVEPDFGDDYYE